MKTIFAYRAQPIGDQVIEPVRIVIEEQMPSPDRMVGTTAEILAKLDGTFQTQAQNLEIALYNSLPGGTYDRLLGEILKRKASHFIVSHAQ